MANCHVFLLQSKFFSVRCNGNIECQGGIDELKCNVSLKVLLWLLSIGFGFLSLTGGILQCFHKKNKALEIPSQDNLDDHKKLSLEDQHKGDLISERFMLLFVSSKNMPTYYSKLFTYFKLNR